jgi:hypothetical protein
VGPTVGMRLIPPHTANARALLQLGVATVLPLDQVIVTWP